MLDKSPVRMFLIILLFASGEALREDISASEHDSQLSSRYFLPPSYPSCFTEGTTWSTEEAVDFVPEIFSVSSCQDLCLESPNCLMFTWYNSQASSLQLTCFLYSSPTAEYPCTDCVSGPQSCMCGGQFLCQFRVDNFVGEFFHIETELLCQDVCFKSSDCLYYNWFEGGASPYPNVCLMFSSCDDKLFNCNTCHSGLADCRNISIITSTTMSSKTTTSLSSSTTTPAKTTTRPSTSTSTTLATTTTRSSTTTTTLSTTTTATTSTAPVITTTITSTTTSTAPTIRTSTTITTTTISTAPSTTISKPSTTTTSIPSTTTTTIPSTTTTTPTTTSTTTPFHPPCDVPKPPNDGDWFCPPSISPYICHLECHPGYVSANETVITCHHGEWSSAPRCVAAVALITGHNDISFYNTAEIYGDGLHKKLPDLPENRQGHSLDVVNSVVLLCGGQYTSASCLALASSYQWIPHSTPTSSRYLHSSASILGKLHLLGGHDSPTSTEVLQPPSDQWSRSWDLIEDNWSSCAAKIGPELLMLTGGVSHPSSVVSYNVTSGAAARLQDLITGRSDHGCVYARDPDTSLGGVLVAGGNDGGNFGLSTSEMYDITSGEWAATGELTTRRYSGIRMVVLGGNILAMGGWGGQSVLASVDKFNWRSRQWTPGENMLEPRHYHAVTGVPPNVVGIAQH